MNIKKLHNFIFPVLFALVTLVITLKRVPFWDETHAFEISGLNFWQIFYMTRIEGHNILWYLILKPFSSVKLYPYSMLVINWLFCVSAIFVLWLKSPFNFLIKLLITFSVPFVFYFAPVSRCYAVGILFLFLICANFKYRYKKPYLFSSLLLICSNTSILAFIPCFYIWVMYLFMQFKRKSSDLKICFLFFLLNSVLLFVQFYNVQKPLLIDWVHDGFVFLLKSYILFPYSNNLLTFIFHVLVFVLFYYSIYCLFKKSKYALFLFLSMFFTLTYLFYFIYTGSYWNYYFYYIYFIMLLWMFYKSYFSNRFIKTLIILVMCFCTVPIIVNYNVEYDLTNLSNSKKIADFISENIDTKNAKIYCVDWWSDVSPAADIYLLKKGIEIYDVLGYKRTSFDSIKRIFQYRTMYIKTDDFYDSLDRSIDNYIVSNGTLMHTIGNFFDKKYGVKVYAGIQDLEIVIWKIAKK